MKIVLAGLGGLVSVFWVWGAFSGRLPSMLAGAISPGWVNSTAATAAPAGSEAVAAGNAGAAAAHAG